MRRLAAAVVVLVFALAPAAAVAAHAPGAITVRPVAGSTLVLTAPAGATRRTAVVVRNGTLLTNAIRLHTVDATTSATGGTQYLTGRAPTGAGSWLTLDLIDVTLGPQRDARVALVLKVPRGTRPGQYVAAVAAAATQDVPNGGGQRLRVVSVVPVQVNVPGATVHGLRIGAATAAGPRRLLVGLANSGNVVESATGTASVASLTGKTVETQTVALRTFLPHTTIQYPLALRRALPPGRYRVAMRLAYGHLTTVARPIVRVTAAPPPATTVPLDTSAATTTAPATDPATTAPAAPIPPAAGLGGGSVPWTWVVVAAVLALLGGLLALFLRGSGPSTAMVTIPLPPPPATPAPAPVAPAPVEAAPVEPTPAEPAPAPPLAAVEAPAIPAAAGGCVHYWQVRYDEPVLGADGVWRFPHVCRDCGVELLARDVSDASAQLV